ncbi:MAG: FliG C-terminal domain-containing protein [Deltaproteobacteria bacterium]|nr:FliG C-terminal domain-containing protein [Deltaproteobacteria bacterium]
MSLSESQLYLACLAYQKEGEKAVDLFNFLSEKSRSLVAGEVQGWLRSGNPVRMDQILREKTLLHPKKSTSFLKEIHPGWILEKLKGESPRFLGLVCRYLPGDKARYLLDHVTPEVKEALLKMDQRLIPDGLAERVRDLVEKRFSSFIPEKKARFSFQHLVTVSGQDLELLFRDLGLEQCRKLFQGSSSKALAVLLSRLPAEETRELKERLRTGKAVDAESRRQAQLAIMSLPLESSEPEDFFMEVGFSVFAMAVSKEEFVWCEALIQKLSPRKGYLLKRVIQEAQAAGATEEKVHYQNHILSRLRQMVQKGTVSRYWKNSSEMEVTRFLKEEMI